MAKPVAAEVEADAFVRPLDRAAAVLDAPVGADHERRDAGGLGVGGEDRAHPRQRTADQLGVVVEEQDQLAVDDLRGEPPAAGAAEIAIEHAQPHPRLRRGAARRAAREPRKRGCWRSAAR